MELIQLGHSKYFFGHWFEGRYLNYEFSSQQPLTKRTISYSNLCFIKFAPANDQKEYQKDKSSVGVRVSQPGTFGLRVPVSEKAN